MSDEENKELDKEKINAELEMSPAEQPERERLKEPQIVSITDVELDTLRNEAAEYKDKYIRLLAESENARKRLQKERQEMIQYALQNMIVDFLAPIDQMENALGHSKQMSEEVKHWAIGFGMILEQFKNVLSTNGVASFSSQGERFDPHHHEAVEMIETDEHTPGTVVKEITRGYQMGKKTIRPALVVVSKAQSQPQENESISSPGETSTEETQI